MIDEYAPSYSISPTGICLFDYFIGDRKYAIKHLQHNAHTKAGLSDKQANRIRKSINWLFMIAVKKTVHDKRTKKKWSFRLNFLTLTLSSKQKHTDNEIRKYMFEPFLRKLRQEYNGLLYVWKAEVQDNGNLHFHLNCNVYIDWRILRDLWNEQQQKLGYIDNDNNADPNSTDIKAVQDAKGLGGYMAKYIGKKDIYTAALKRYHRLTAAAHKNEKVSCSIPANYFARLKRKITIKLWDCSSLIKKIKITKLGYNLKEAIAIDKVIHETESVSDDYFQYHFGIDWFEMEHNVLKQHLLDSLREIRTHVGKQNKKIVIED